jgi:hypothetical protein
MLLLKCQERAAARSRAVAKEHAAAKARLVQLGPAAEEPAAGEHGAEQAMVTRSYCLLVVFVLLAGPTKMDTWHT